VAESVPWPVGEEIINVLDDAHWFSEAQAEAERRNRKRRSVRPKKEHDERHT
jgi:hypothetical protein